MVGDAQAICQRNRGAPLFEWITALAPPTAYSLCALLEPYMFPGERSEYDA
jgi:hypothetical protein